MIEFLRSLAQESNYMPYGQFFYWDAKLLWLHVGADILTGLAYYVIAGLLIYFIVKRQDVPFNWIFILFGAFIFACGSTHFMSAWTVYVPSYWGAGVLKAVNAAIFTVAAVVLISLMPRILTLPSLKKALDENTQLNSNLQLKITGLEDEIEKRIQAEEALQSSEELFKGAFTDAAIGMALVSQDHSMLLANQAYCDLLGYTKDELEGVFFKDITHPDDVSVSLDYHQRLVDGVCDHYHFEKRYIHKQGHVIWALLSVSLIRGKDGKHLYSIAQIQDVTVRKQIEKTLIESEIKSRTLLEDSPVCTKIIDLDSRLQYMSTAGAKSLKLTDIEHYYGQIYPPEFYSESMRAPLVEHLDRAKAGETSSLECPVLDIEGGTVWFHTTFVPVRDAEGQIEYIIGTSVNITERKQLEQQLQQALKMEAVGQLTGGVAHDFNNLLAIIQGNLELLGERLEDDVKATHYLEKATFNVQRGSQLTQRLLAFSRKQMLEPTPLDLNKLIQGMHELLQRTLGETIEIEIVCAGSLWRCFADHAQVENCLLNLAINGRDAMPKGGKLSIEVANVELDEDYVARHVGTVAGQYVMLAVSDTGTGMSDETLAHVFEPFYTTKDVGKGSGLGLSMVYGFTKQSRGYITVDSEVDEGTTFKLHLPRDTESTAVEEKKPITVEIPTGQHETVLVVEDEPDLLEIVVAQLEGLGYTVLSASDGATALEVAEKNGDIDMLLTDVILTGAMSGCDVAETLQKQRPALKVVYMSGYTEDAIVDQGLLNSTIQLIKKPFTKTELARKIRARLDDD